MRPTGPRPALRWRAIYPGGARVLEYLRRDAGSCVGCGEPTSWAWVGSIDDWRDAWNRVVADHHPLAYSLRVRGVGKDGRVTCFACRTRVEAARW